jgi:hypothetical protein
VPGMASPVLNHAIICLEKYLSSIIQLQMQLARDNHVEIHRVGRVHARMSAFQNIQHPRQLVLNLFDSRSCVDAIEAPPRSRWYGEETEAETILWGE